MKLYGSETVNNLIEAYTEKNGEVLTIEEGCLGHGHMVLFGSGLKTTIIKEVFINHWSSGHKIRSYNKTPKKYIEIIENY